MDEATILDRYSDPNIWMPAQLARKLRQSLVALSENLERVVVRPAHHIKDPLDVVQRHVLVEEITHRVHEDHPWTRPSHRLLQTLRPEAQVEPLLVRVAWNPAPSLGKRLGIAVGTAWRHRVTARDRVPCRLGPLNRAVIRHIALVRWPPTVSF